MRHILCVVLLASCIVAASAGSQSTRDVEVLATGEVVPAAEKNVTVAQLVHGSAGATWSIKMPSCPSDLNVCCGFFQNWNWNSWDGCANQVLYVGKQLVKKAMEVLDYLTDAQKLAGLLMSGPVGRKLFQLYDWGKKAIMAMQEAVENIIEGLVKVCMAIIRLFLAVPKIPGCWNLDSNRRAFVMWSANFAATDCGAMSTLKKIDMWGFVKNLGTCFIRLTNLPHSGGLPLPTPFLSRVDMSVCLYHIPPIVAQLIDGIVQIVKAIVTLVLDIVLLALQLVDIIVQDIISHSSALYKVLQNAQNVVNAMKNSINGNPPSSVESVAARSASAQLQGDVHEEEEVTFVLPSSFKAAFSRELSRLTESAQVVDATYAEEALRSKDLAGAAVRHMMYQSGLRNPMVWQTMGYNGTADADEDGEGSIVERWGQALALEMDVPAMLDTVISTVMAEQMTDSSKGSSNFAFSIGLNTACNWFYEKGLNTGFGVPFLAGSAAPGVSISLSIGQATDANGGHFSLGLGLKVSGSVTVKLDIGDTGADYADDRLAARNADAAARDNKKQACEGGVWGGRSITLGAGLTGAPCMSPITIANAIPTAGWGFAIAMPIVIKAILFVVCQACAEKLPGDLIHFVAGYGDFTKKDKWFFNVGFNFGPDYDWKTKSYNAIDAAGKFLVFKMSLSLSWSVFFGIACKASVVTGLVKATHGICLDASQRGSNGGKVHMWSCNAGNYNQQWTFNSGTKLIKNKHGICLDASQRSSNGGKVHMWSCNAANANQQWAYNEGSSNGQIKAVHGICLDASQRSTVGGKVHMWSCNTGNHNQQWTASFFAGSLLQKDMALSERVKSSMREKMAKTCDEAAAARSCKAAAGEQSAESLAKCVQESMSSRLACGEGADLEALHAETPLVDQGLQLKVNGRQSSGIRVRLFAGWMSGLSSLRATTTSPSMLHVESGVRTKLALETKEAVQVRQVCLQWSSLDASNAFRAITGPALSVQQRALQMASALEEHAAAKAGMAESAEAQSTAEWASLLQTWGSQHRNAGQMVHVEEASEVEKDGDMLQCFKVRVGSVRAHVDASFVGSAGETGFQAKEAELHTLSVEDLRNQVEQDVLASASMQAAVDAVLESLKEPTVSDSSLKEQLQTAIASRIASGVQQSVHSGLCETLARAACAECHVDKTWAHTC